MKRTITCLLAIFGLFTVICTPAICQTQEKNFRTDKVYFRSGFGFTVPVGESNEYLTTKFSTSLGMLYALGKGPLFVYPKLNLHAFGFNQLMADSGNQTLAKVGRATTYLLNVAMGYRKSVGQIGFYGYMGGGGGLVLTPRIILNPGATTATQHNETTAMPILETGGGVDYALGNTQLFIEASYLGGFRKIEDKTFHSVPVNVGVKTNISRIFFK
jgi:hypothetical protein